MSGEDYSFYCQHSLAVHLRVGPCDICHPLHVTMLLVMYFFSSGLGSHIVEVSWVFEASLLFWGDSRFGKYSLRYVPLNVFWTLLNV